MYLKFLGLYYLYFLNFSVSFILLSYLLAILSLKIKIITFLKFLHSLSIVKSLSYILSLSINPGYITEQVKRMPNFQLPNLWNEFHEHKLTPNPTTFKIAL